MTSGKQVWTRKSHPFSSCALSLMGIVDKIRITEMEKSAFTNVISRNSGSLRRRILNTSDSDKGPL